MNNDNIQLYLTIVSNNLNAINSMIDLMKSHERTINHLLGTQHNLNINRSTSVPVRSTNNSYTPNSSRENTPRVFYTPRYRAYDFPQHTTQNYKQNIDNLARQIISSALYTINEQ